jgi:hypothetical protein
VKIMSKDLANILVLSITVLMGEIVLIGAFPRVIAQGMSINETELIINQTMNNQSDAAIMSNETAVISNQSEMTNATIATPVNETGNPIVDTLKDMFDR